MQKGQKGRFWTFVTALAITGGVMAAPGCAVRESDVQRWETTEHGPDKLYAIVTHDKYKVELRAEAAMSLIRMRPRGGDRIGLKYLVLGVDSPEKKVSAMAALSEEWRRKIVKAIAPKLSELIRQPAPAKGADGTILPDPSVPYKDAAFAMISHEPPLISDPDIKKEMVAALTQWVQTDFEARIDNSSQQYGVEQIMRYLGAPSAKALPASIRLDSPKVDRATTLLTDLGDDETKKRGAEALVGLAKSIDSQAWIDKQRPIVDDANKRSKLEVTADQLNEQLRKYQEQELEKVFGNMRKLGGRSVVDYCIAYAVDGKKSGPMRLRALAAIENRVDKNSAADVQNLFSIIKEEGNPDDVRGLALRRFGELPKDMIVPKLYTLFSAKKWQVRLDAANLVLKSIAPKDLPEFMKQLPKEKMGLSEPISYGSLIMQMEGTPKPREALSAFLSGKDTAPKLVAVGSFFGAKKAEMAPLSALEGDSAPIPKCEEADKCGWQCDVPKAGSSDKETKTIATVGDFVKFCVMPSAQN